MIKNERQYRITRAQAARFEEALELVRRDAAHNQLPPRIRQIKEESLQGQLDSLRAELAEYEALKSGETERIELDRWEKIPQALIQARIAANLTQKELAERVGIAEQEIQRYEATDYATVSFARLTEIVNALGLQTRAEFIPLH
jgi:DNA-binding Xre family transcriptional regulator